MFSASPDRLSGRVLPGAPAALSWLAGLGTSAGLGTAALFTVSAASLLVVCAAALLVGFSGFARRLAPVGGPASLRTWPAAGRLCA